MVGVGTELVRKRSFAPQGRVYQGFQYIAVQSIIGATLKRRDTVAPVFTGDAAEFCTILLYVLSVCLQGERTRCDGAQTH